MLELDWDSFVDALLNDDGMPHSQAAHFYHCLSAYLTSKDHASVQMDNPSPGDSFRRLRYETM